MEIENKGKGNKSTKKRKSEAPTDENDESVILYDLWELCTPWTEEEVVLEGPSTNNLTSRVKAIGTFGINGFFSIIGSKIRVGEAIASIVPSSLLEYILKEGPRCQILLSNEGDHLVVIQKHKVSLRSAEEEFSENHIVWEAPEDPRPQWRRSALCSEYKMIALVTSQNTFYILDYVEGKAIYSFQGIQLSPALVDGVASIAFRITTCEAKGTHKCPELLVLGFDGILRRVHVPAPKSKISAAGVHPLQLVDGSSKSCSESTSVIRLQPWHSSVACTAFHTLSNLLAVGGSGGSVSLWKLSDNPPYSENLKSSTSPNKSGYFGNFVQLRKEDKSIIHKLCFSPNGKYLAGIDLQGNVTLWHVSDLSVHREFKSKDVSTSSDPIHDISWWNNNSLVLAKVEGETTILSLNGKNLMSKTEKFENCPSVTDANNNRFFALDFKTQTLKVPRLVTDQNEDNQESIFTFSNIISAMTFGYLSYESTTSPSFEKRLRRTYKLTSFNKSTPEEIFKRKVEMEEYGAALTIARTYGINPDLVFQKRWSSLDVTMETIPEFLDKINDREWVRFECERRIPSSLQSNKYLLEYGKKNSGPENSENIPSSFDKEFISECLHRLIFLIYLDRLDSFSKIHNNFDANEFGKYRETHLVEVAIDFAYQENMEALKILFTYHGDILLPYRMYILSHIPETTSPHSFEFLLPELEDSQEKLWNQVHRDKDWVEDDEVLKKMSIKKEIVTDVKLIKLKLPIGNIKEFERENYSMRLKSRDVYLPIDSYAKNEDPFTVKGEFEPSYPSKSEVLTQWYIYRSKQIEERSGQVENALQLIEHGIAKGVKGLEEAHDHLKELNNLVYDCDVDITLQKYEELSDYDRFYLLLKDSNEDNITDNLRYRASSFLAKDEKNNYSMLKQYMIEMARIGKLKICECIIYESRPIDTLDKDQKIIKDPLLLIDIALSCIYATKTVNQWDIMNEIFTSLPVRDPSEKEESYHQLHNRVDAFEHHLSASETLDKYQLAPPISFYQNLNTKEGQSEALNLMFLMCHQSVLSKPAFTSNQWENLFQDMTKLRDSVFTFISKKDISTRFMDTLLKSGNLNLAKKYLQQAAPEVAEELVLNASREYFNSAASIDDEAMSTASKILGIAPATTQAITDEINLNRGVEILAEFGASLLPLQIRLHKNRIEIIENLIKTHPHAYRDTNKIIKLASYLTKTSNASANSHLNMLLAETAILRQDYTSACNSLMKLINSNYGPAWTLCVDLAKTEEFNDFDNKKVLVAFAMAHCPGEMLPEIVDLSKKIEFKSILKTFNIEAKDGAEAIQRIIKLKENTLDRRHVKPFSFTLKPLLKKLEDLSTSIYDKNRSKIESSNLNETILRIAALTNTKISDDILLELAEHYLYRDTPIALGHLLNLNKITDANKLLEKHITGQSSSTTKLPAIKFGCYVYGLYLLRSHLPTDEFKNLVHKMDGDLLDILIQKLNEDNLKEKLEPQILQQFENYRKMFEDLQPKKEKEKSKEKPRAEGTPEPQTKVEHKEEETEVYKPKVFTVTSDISPQAQPLPTALPALSTNHLHHHSAGLAMNFMSNINPSSVLFNATSGYAILKQYFMTQSTSNEESKTAVESINKDFGIS